MLGPLFSVELIGSARRTRYFLLRVLYALALLVILMFVYLDAYGLGGASNIQAAAVFGQKFFYAFAVLQLLAILALGPAVAAGLIARERERRTIEYLFTTHLTNAEIVLGKLAAAIVQIAALVLAGLPILALAMLLGGIGPDLLLAVFALTASTAAGLAALALAASVVAPRSRDAIVSVYFFLFALLVGPLLADLLLRTTPAGPWFAPAIELAYRLNPLVVLARVLDADTPRQAAERWFDVGTTAAVYLGFALVAAAVCAAALRRVHRGGPSAARTPRRRWRLWRPALGDRPMLWKEWTAGTSRSRWALAGRVMMNLVALGSAVALVVLFVDCMLTGRRDAFLGYTMIFTPLLGGCALLLLAAAASNAVAWEREQETWLMLISTPLEGREILGGKLLGSFRSPALMLLPLALLWVLAAVADPGFLLSVPFTMVGLLASGLSSALVGLFFSLVCRSSARALAATVGVGVATLVVGYCCCLLSGINPLVLIAMPASAYLMASQLGTGEMGVLIAMFGIGWVGGMVIHIAAAGVLWVICTQEFDRLAGRLAWRPGAVSPYAPLPPLVAAELAAPPAPRP